MIIDRQGKLFGKVNIIDLFVIVFVIAAICVTFFKFTVTSDKGSAEANVPIEYTIKVYNVRDFTLNQIISDEKLYDDETGKCIGVIEGVKKEDSMEYVLKDDGTYVYSKRPERSDIIITVKTNGTIKDNGYFAEGIRQIAPHSTIIISNKRFKTSGSVESVKKIGE